MERLQHSKILLVNKDEKRDDYKSSLFFNLLINYKIILLLQVDYSF